MASLIQRVIQIVDRHSQPNQPRPKFTIKAQLQRSILFEQMEERKAQLETMRAQEQELRGILVNALSMAAYNAERARFRIETRSWELLTDSDFADAAEHVKEAADALRDAVREIAAKASDIADDQKDLDDAELWEQVVSA
jgi:uncharacterized alpha-E superfamily protein